MNQEIRFSLFKMNRAQFFKEAKGKPWYKESVFWCTAQQSEFQHSFLLFYFFAEILSLPATELYYTSWLIRAL